MAAPSSVIAVTVGASVVEDDTFSRHSRRSLFAHGLYAHHQSKVTEDKPHFRSGSSRPGLYSCFGSEHPEKQVGKHPVLTSFYCVEAFSKWLPWSNGTKVNVPPGIISISVQNCP